jgi:hypothetical protein
MKMVKSLILGSAAGIVAIAGAQAADLPVKAKPVQYVKICSLYGAGFYYIPGTDTCIKIGGFLRAEMNFNANGSFNPYRVQNFDAPGRNREVTRWRAAVTFDVRSQTEYGTLRSYLLVAPTGTNGQNIGGTPYIDGNTGTYVNAAFIQFAGFTAGSTASFFDFDTNPYANFTNTWGSNQAGNGIPVFAYTAQFGGGWSASISAEDATVRRQAILDSTWVAGSGAAPGAANGYGGRRWPDVVANLRIDQAWGGAQIMGAIHDVYANNSTGAVSNTLSATGWAVGAGIKLNAPSIGAKDYFIAQIGYAKGANNYNMSNGAAGGINELLTTGFPVVGKAAEGVSFDGVVIGGAGTGTSISLAKTWSITGGYEHYWNAAWKTSLYGAYGKVGYDAAANTVFGGNANWSLWQLGSRTVWTPVQNLDLSVELLYTDLNHSSFSGTPPFGSKGFLAGMFRVQRNFWP